MAGVFPLPNQTSGRKQWTLYNGSNRGIKSLGNQLAEDSCPESQVALAKQLLFEKCELDADQEENAKYGVYWLIKASEQGHEEATQILSDCLESGKGISEHNILDVKACLDMSQEEKLARTAAKKLFDSMSGGENFITSKQLENKILQLEDSFPSDDDCINQDWKNRTELGEKLSVEMLTSAASTYARGEMPLIQSALCLNTTSSRSALVQYTYRPITTVCSFSHHLCHTLSVYDPRSIVRMLLYQLQIAFWVCVYLIFGIDTLITVMPLIMYLISFGCMVVATCQILLKKHDFANFKRWSQLFVAYSTGLNLNTQEAEYQHCRNNLKPYGLFFSALLVQLFCQPSAPEYLTPFSELTIISYIFTFLTVYHFAVEDIHRPRSSIDFLALFSFAVHVLAKYPYETDTVISQNWRFMDFHLPTFASYVVGNGVEFCLNFRALFYLVIPAILIKMASRNGFRGTFTTFLPHCVALSWWQIAIVTSEGATWYGLIRSVLALVGIVFFIPLSGLVTVILPAIAAGKYLAGRDVFIHVTTTAGIAILPVITALLLGKIRPRGAIFRSALRWVQVTLAVVAGVLLLWPAVYQEDYSMDTFESSLTWMQFREHCMGQNPKLSMEIPSQLHCVQLMGTPVRWEGRVIASRLVSVNNPVMNIVDRLSNGLRKSITCAIGEKIIDEKHKNPPQDISHQDSDLPVECRLSNWNRYEFEIDVSMTLSAGSWLEPEGTLTLTACHSFQNFTSSLTAGDHIWFAGYLQGSSSGIVEASQPRINLIQVGCINCKNENISHAMKIEQEFFFFSSRDVKNGVKSVLNFVFNPIVIFR